MSPELRRIVRRTLRADMAFLRSQLSRLGRDRTGEVTREIRDRIIDAELAALTTQESLAMLEAA